MVLDLWRAEKELQDIDKWFNYVTSNWTYPEGHIETIHWYYPKMNVFKKKQDDGTIKYDIKLMIPGYDKDDLKVELLDNNTIVVSGTHEDKLKENYNSELEEYKIKSNFNRKIVIPNIQSDSIDVKYKNGILNIELISGKRVNRKTIDIE